MTKMDLIEQLKEVPDDALIYVYADHGQTSQRAGCVTTTISKDLPYRDDEGIFYSDDIIEDKAENPNAKITAVEIS